ncbi:helix-turn-helix domain-containing protein [Niveispirillum sp.]|uniref:helix-turn-helix domain-containing protein n=1 Tax=Niveispirillum sp. TaxID=1917217 RepID=UPI001B6C2165|nr:helix-turn-helix domain-containing protein [Niveispirillum sp.]MBP7334824.1 helix-turn-helix domain-containing protein [Niveispirillum sp.]
MSLAETESWSSQSMPVARRFRGFQDVLDRTHFHWDLHVDRGDNYSAEVLRRPVDDFVFTHVVADPLAGWRRADDIRKSHADYFCLLFLEQGHTLLEQGRNQTELVAGSISLWDSTRPAYFAAREVQHQYSLLIPRQAALSALPSIEDMCGLQVRGDSGVGAVLLAHLRQLHRSIDSIDPADRPAMLRATVELAAIAFRPELERLNGSAFQRALLTRVQDYINLHVGDPDLGPQSIAAAFRFSPRYLHRLFEATEMTVSEWIKQRRLQRCRADLAAVGCDGLSLTQIAMKNGFADASQFSRSFRAAFGTTPREFRQQARDTRA